LAREHVHAKRGAAAPTSGAKRVSFSSQNRRRSTVSASEPSSSSRVSVAASLATRLKSRRGRSGVSSTPAPGRRQPLQQQPRGDVVVGGEDEARVELLGLQHVVLEHRRDRLQRLARVAVQRDDALDTAAAPSGARPARA
jgi:hypothetical protein